MQKTTTKLKNEVFIFNVKLRTNSPLYQIRRMKGDIWREIAVLNNWSLYELAGAIVESFNFDFDHCFGFFSNISEYNYFDSEKRYELFADLKDQGIEQTGAKSVKKTKIKEVWQKVGDKIMFLFDYGDDWQFIVKLIGFSERENKQEYPRILKKVGRAPRQY